MSRRSDGFTSVVLGILGKSSKNNGERKNILITGASAGLGEGMAKQWAARGFNLALAARRLDNLQALREELLAANPSISVEVAALDVADPEAVRRVFTELDDKLGGIDRYVLNAGLGKGASVGSGKAWANAETATVNVLGTLHQAEVAIELMRARGGGHLVFISSIASRRGMLGAETTYGATKAFVTSLAQGIHAEQRRRGSQIKVSTILPGYIATEMTSQNKSPLKADLDKGVQALVAAIDREPTQAAVPPLPWTVVDPMLRFLPEPVSRKLL